MRYLLDTNTLSGLMKTTRSPALVQRMAMTAIEDRATSTVSLAELLFGAHKAGSRSEELLQRIGRAVPADMQLLAFDAAAADQYGQLRAYLEAQGTPIGHPDTQIAAIALANDLTVVTGNVRHFQRVPGLAVEDWLE